MDWNQIVTSNRVATFLLIVILLASPILFDLAGRA